MYENNQKLTGNASAPGGKPRGRRCPARGRAQLCPPDALPCSLFSWLNPTRQSSAPLPGFCSPLCRRALPFMGSEKPNTPEPWPTDQLSPGHPHSNALGRTSHSTSGPVTSWRCRVTSDAACSPVQTSTPATPPCSWVSTSLRGRRQHLSRCPPAPHGLPGSASPLFPAIHATVAMEARLSTRLHFSSRAFSEHRAAA